MYTIKSDILFLSRIAAHCVLCICVALIALPSATAFEYGGIGGKPAFPRPDNPRTDSIFVHTLNPGDLQEEGVMVINNTEERKDLVVYAADSTPSTDGGFACKQRSQKSTGVGSWIALEKEQVTLEPHANITVPFTITVPANAEIGEHNGCILIQAASEPQDDAASGISLSMRTGLRVAVTVPGDIVRTLTLRDVLVQRKSIGYIIIHPIVSNDGNVSIDTHVTAVTKNLLGTIVDTQELTSPVLNGQSSEWNFDVPTTFWGGFYRTTVTVEYDPHAEAGVGIQSGKELTVLEQITGWYFVAPTASGFVTEVIILLILIATGLWLWFFFAHRKWVREHWHEYTVLPGDNLQQLGTHFHISWKHIARVNKLKAPYALAPGQIIMVPPEPPEQPTK